MAKYTGFAVNENRKVTVDLKTSRRAVNAGRASWTILRPRATMAVHPEVEAHCGQPAAPTRVALAGKPTRRVFGEGLGARCPSYRLPGGVTPADLDWLAQQNAVEEQREIDRMGQIAAYEARFDGWY